MTKIGLLLPSSNINPLLTKELLTGIKAAFEEKGIDYELFPDNIGLGTNGQEIKEKAQNLILYKEVDVIFTMVGPLVLPELIEVVSAHNQKLVLMDFGVSPELDGKIRMGGENIISNDFKLWETCWHLGYYAGANLGKRIFSSSDFFHSGYPLLSAFEKGLKQSGGELCGFHICGQHPFEVDTSGEESFKKAKECNADAILALYSAANITSIVEESKKQEEISIPILCHCLSLDDSIEGKFSNVYYGTPKAFDQVKSKMGFNNWNSALAYLNALDYLNASETKNVNQFEIKKGWKNENISTSENDHKTQELILKSKESDPMDMVSGWTNPYPCI